MVELDVMRIECMVCYSPGLMKDWIYDSLRIQSHRNMYLHMFYCLGGIVFTCFFIQVASGFAMTFYYSPTLSVGQSTLTRFYSLHTFVLPVSLTILVVIHFLMIRKQGISGPF